MIYLENFSLTAGLLVIIIGVGYFVRRSGKPYNGVLFNLHKLTALGAVILTVVRLLELDPIITFPVNALVLIGLAALSVIGLFSTGAAMSIQSEVKPMLSWIHRGSTVIALISLISVLLTIS